jgi:type IV secretory pathway VirB6-like protein
MNFKSLVAQLANRINQPHVVETYMRKVFASGVEWQKKQSPWISVEEQLPQVGTLGLFFMFFSILF